MTIRTLLSKLKKKPQKQDSESLSIDYAKQDTESLSIDYVRSLSIDYVRLVGNACEAYYVDVIVRTEGGESAPVKMVVDTGAMISTIPESAIKDKSLLPILLGRPVILRDYEGRARRAKTYVVDLLILKDCLPWAVSRPPRGVTARREEVGTTENVGLLGLDVLHKFIAHFDTDEAYMVKKDGGEE